MTSARCCALLAAVLSLPCLGQSLPSVCAHDPGLPPAPTPLWSSGSTVYASATAIANPLSPSNPRAFSISIRVAPDYQWDANPTLRGMISIGTWGTTNSITVFSQLSNLYCDMYDSAGVNHQLTTPSVFPGYLSRSQHRVACAYSNGALSLWVDGVRVAQQLGPYTFSQPATINVDGSGSPSIPSFGSRLFNVAVSGPKVGASTTSTDPTQTVAAVTGEFDAYPNDYVFQGAPDVSSVTPTRYVMVLGDSISAGAFSNVPSGSLTLGGRRYAGWLESVLGSRYQAINLAQSGSTLSSHKNQYDANRAAHDYSAAGGTGCVFHLGGINDLVLLGSDAATIIGLLGTFWSDVQSHGDCLVVGTLTPFKGTAYYNGTSAATRQTVNAWIRANYASYGAKLADLDVLTRDSVDSEKLLAAYDCGDHLHPSTTGTKAIFSEDARVFAPAW